MADIDNAPLSDVCAVHRAGTTGAAGRIASASKGASDEAFEPGAVRYIKLGQNGKWAAEAVEQGTIPFGYPLVDHDVCLAGDWDEVKRQLSRMGRSPRGVTQGVRELKDFYELPANTLWVTAAHGHFWWAFADGPAIEVKGRNSDEPARYRRTRAGWCKTNLAGEPLTVRSLGSALTRTSSYQMTICTIKQADHLLRRIRGERDPLHVEAMTLRLRLRELALRLIQQLDWRDLEILVDLIFARGGWQRTSVLGEGLPDVDLILSHPTTGETAWIQVKSQTSQAELDDYLRRFRRDGSCDRFFFVCHSFAGTLSLPSESRLHLWAGDRLAAAALDAGLFDWLLEAG